MTEFPYNPPPYMRHKVEYWLAFVPYEIAYKQARFEVGRAVWQANQVIPLRQIGTHLGVCLEMARTLKLIYERTPRAPVSNFLNPLNRKQSPRQLLPEAQFPPPAQPGNATPSR
jgi:hypothetical protein